MRTTPRSRPSRPPTTTAVDSAAAEIAEARAGARFDADAQQLAAQTERFELNPGFAGKYSLEGDNLPLSGPVNFHSVRFEGLEPDRLYAYRVRTNAAGHRMDDQIRGDAHHVIAFSDSFTFGWGVELEDAFYSHVKSAVESWRSDLQLVNRGAGGASTSSVDRSTAAPLPSKLNRWAEPPSDD